MAQAKRGLRMSEKFVGIDFGTTKICVIIGQMGPHGIEIVGIGKQPSIGIKKGVVVNIPSTVEAIQKAADVAKLMAGCDITHACVGIAGSHIQGFNSVGIVAIKDKEITEGDVARAVDAAKAVAMPANREVIHVLPQEFIVDEQDGVKDPVGMSGVRLEAKVHIVTGAVSSAQNIVKCANKAGIQVTNIILEPLASAAAVLTKDEKELGVALVDMGGGTTDIALYVRGSLVHTASIAMGGNHITSDIAVGLRTTLQDAELIKIQSGCAMGSLVGSDEAIEVPSASAKTTKELSQSVLAKIIEPRMEEILSLVNQDIMNSGVKHLLPTGVVITGGGSLLRGTAELAEFILEMPVRRGSPENVGGLADAVQSPSLSTAVGLLKFAAQDHTDELVGVQGNSLHSRIFNKMRSWLGEVF